MKLFGNILVLALSGLALLVVIGIAGIYSLPNVKVLEKCMTTSMYQVHLCPGSANYVPLREISPYMIHALIVAEDGSFYSHEGFDWHEMEESFTTNLRSGKIRRGGSTLTQQLAKNVFLDKEKSLWRKIKEAYLAVALERHYTKDFILEKYLNVVEFGQDLYGIKPASLKYFHKPPSQLTPLESAWLAMLLPNPKGYSKSYYAGKLTPFTKKMVSTILRRMAAYGKLSPQGYETAMANLGAFPWSGISIDAFQGAPTYSLEAKIPASFSEDEEPADEQTLDEMLKEEGHSEAPAATDAAPAPAEEPAENTDSSTDSL